MPTTRASISRANRIVVKIGSSSLSSVGGGLKKDVVANLADAVARRRNTGHEVIVVSSGAISTGMPALGLTKRPKDLPTQQAAASVGQGILLAAYTAAFAEHNITVGQVLLTSEDVARRSHYRNAQLTFDRLLELDVLPIVNENDTVATDEIRLGDNDRLAALVAHVTNAQALVLLSDIDGLYDGPPHRPDSRHVPEVGHYSELVSMRIGGIGSEGIGSGERKCRPLGLLQLRVCPHCSQQQPRSVPHWEMPASERHLLQPVSAVRCDTCGWPTRRPRPDR